MRHGVEKPGGAAGLQRNKQHQTWGIPGGENSLNLGEYWGEILHRLAFFLLFLGAHGLICKYGGVFSAKLSLLAQRSLLYDPSASASSADLIIFHQQDLISHLLQATSFEKCISAECTQVLNLGSLYQIQSFCWLRAFLKEVVASS